MMLSMLHTLASNAVLFEGLLSEMAPDVPFHHQVEEDLLRNAMRVGSGDADVVAAVEGATIGGIAENVELTNGVPVLRVDSHGPQSGLEGARIVIAAAVASTLSHQWVLGCR
jgi:hypothetical protein